MADLKGRRAVVTGGSRGIGAAIVRRLAADGARVAFTYVKSRDAAEALAAELSAGGAEVIALQADSADVASLTAAIDTAAARFGGLDVLVSNAGVGQFTALDEITPEQFDWMVATNVKGVVFGAKAAAAHMGEGGRIINISSVNALKMPFPGGALYGMTKAAVGGFTRGAARDLAARGITVVDIQPGPVDTEMNPADGPLAELMHSGMAVKRHARAEEIAALTAFLASTEQGQITGAGLLIDGGFAA